MEEQKNGAFDPDAYYKELQAKKNIKKNKTGIGLEFNIIKKYLLIMTASSVLLTLIIYLIKYLFGLSHLEIIEDIFLISIWLIVIPFAYNMSGFFVGRSVYTASASVSAWTGKGMDGKRSMRDMRSFISVGKIMIFSVYMGALNLIVITLFFK